MNEIPVDQAIMLEQQMIAQYRGQVYQLQMQIENYEGAIAVCEGRLRKMQLLVSQGRTENI